MYCMCCFLNPWLRWAFLEPKGSCLSGNICAAKTTILVLYVCIDKAELIYFREYTHKVFFRFVVLHSRAQSEENGMKIAEVENYSFYPPGHHHDRVLGVTWDLVIANQGVYIQGKGCYRGCLSTPPTGAEVRYERQPGSPESPGTPCPFSRVMGGNNAS